MSELPRNWALTHPLEIGVPIRGVSYKKDDAINLARDGYIPILRANNIQNGKFDLADLVYVANQNISHVQKLQRNDIVFAMSSGSISVVGKSAQVKSDLTASFGAFCGVLRPKNTVVPRYIGYFFMSDYYRTAISTMARGVNINNLKWSHFEDLKLPLAPLTEQKRIVEKLDTTLARVDNCRDRLDQVALILKRFRQSVLAAAMSGRLTAHWSALNPTEAALSLVQQIKERRFPKNQNSSVRSDLELHIIPKNWEWTSLQFLMSPSESFCYGVVQPGEDDPNGAFLIRAGDLNFGKVDTAALRRIPLSVHKEFHRSQIVGGEILITVVGAGIGEVAIAQPECAGFNIARAVAKVPVREFSAKFVYLWLSTNQALRWMKGDSREVARPTLNLEQLKTLPVPLPPMAEQLEIVRCVETLFSFADRLDARLTAARTSVERVTPSLLAKAFRGDLVAQDPNDEPAIELLKRLTATCEGVAKSTRARKAA